MLKKPPPKMSYLRFDVRHRQPGCHPKSLSITHRRVTQTGTLRGSDGKRLSRQLNQMVFGGMSF
jgi:hypothetical protein